MDTGSRWFFGSRNNLIFFPIPNRTKPQQRERAKHTTQGGDIHHPIMAASPPLASQSAFLFVANDVHSNAVEPYMDYVRAVVPTVPTFGGRYLCRQGAIHVVPSPRPPT